MDSAPYNFRYRFAMLLGLKCPALPGAVRLALAAFVPFLIEVS